MDSLFMLTRVSIYVARFVKIMKGFLIRKRIRDANNYNNLNDWKKLSDDHKEYFQKNKNKIHQIFKKFAELP